MTSLLDSTAHFSDRCLKLGLGQQFVTALHRAGVDNLSRLAFAVGQPGQAIQNNDVEDFLQRALGRASTLVEASSIKRMAFEAHTYLVATLRQQVDHTDDAQPRKVAFAERNQSEERWSQHTLSLTKLVPFLRTTRSSGWNLQFAFLAAWKCKELQSQESSHWRRVL